MNIKKSFINFVFIFVFIFGLNTSLSFAETQSGSVFQSNISKPVIVATVNIYNAKIISQKDRDFIISFDISNDIGAQTNVRYAVSVTKLLNKNNVIIDQFVYPEIFSVAKGETIHKEINYSIPASVVGGEYQIRIISRTTSDLPLGFAFLGNINIKSNNNSVSIIPDSCSIIPINLENISVIKRFETAIGFNESDTIKMTCTVINNGSVSLNLIPFFETHIKSLFGDVISTSGGTKNELIINPGTQKISVELPKAKEPQTYTVLFRLEDGKNIKTNNIEVKYSIVGPIGTIQNVVFDKTAYKDGELAIVNVFGVFMGEKFSTSTNSSSDIKQISINIKDQNNNLCGGLIHTYTSTSTLVNEKIEIPIVANCINPTAEVSFILNDKKIDTANMNILSIKKDTEGLEGGKSFSINIYYIFGLFILMIVSLTYFLRNRRTLIKNILIFIFIIGSFFYSIKKAEALTYAVGEQGYILATGYCYYNSYGLFMINTNKTNYFPGENIIISTYIENGGGYNFQECSGGPETWVSAGGIGSITVNGVGPRIDYGDGSYAITAPISAGYYPVNAWFLGETDHAWHDFPGYTPYPWSVFDQDVEPFGITVTNPATASITADSGLASTTPIPKNSSTNITWTSSGVDTGVVIINGSSTPWAAPYYKTVATTTYYPAQTHTTTDRNGVVTTVIDVPATTTITYTQVYVPGINDSTSSPPLAPGTNTFTFKGYKNGISTPLVTKSVVVYVSTSTRNRNNYATDSITASQTTVAYGASTLISWDSVDANSCSVNIDKGNTVINGWKTSLSGSAMSDAITGPTNFIISCLGNNNIPALASVSVSNSTTTPVVTSPSNPPSGTATTQSVPCVMRGPDATSNIYANKNMTWNISTGISGNTIWSGDGIGVKTTTGTSLNLIYNTIGLKTIYATTTDPMTGNKYTCFATTTVTVAPGTTGSI